MIVAVIINQIVANSPFCAQAFHTCKKENAQLIETGRVELNTALGSSALTRSMGITENGI